MDPLTLLLVIVSLYMSAKVTALCIEVFMRTNKEAKKQVLWGYLVRKPMRVEFDENGRVESFGIKRRPRQY